MHYFVHSVNIFTAKFITFKFDLFFCYSDFFEIYYQKHDKYEYKSSLYNYLSSFLKVLRCKKKYTY